MTQQFFFMFSHGSYSDYSVGGLFVCDHEVSEQEWDAHYKCYQEKSRILYEEQIESGIGSESRMAYRQWVIENDPETTFQKLHGMTPVACSEFWRDY